MDFRIGDSVMHWVYGLGKIMGLEEKDFPGRTGLFYAVQARDITVWVPVDDELSHRLRPPTSRNKFKELFEILSGPGEHLPSDRLERRTLLEQEHNGGRAEANCRIIRDLSRYQQENHLNDNDRLVLKMALNSLLGEWIFSLAVSPDQAERELWRLVGNQPHLAGI